MTKDEKKKRVAERAELRAGRSPQEQLNRLDEMLGKGKGAVAERAKLQKQVEEARE